MSSNFTKMDGRKSKARNWFHWTQKVFSKPKQELIEPISDLDKDTSDNYNYLPPELVNNILRRACVDSLFACRLVNQQWNSVASKELERRSLLHWTSFETVPASWNRLYSSLSPSVILLETFVKLMYSTVKLPLAISTSKEFSSNPFPTNSLTIWWSYPHPFFSKMRPRSMRWDKFFCQYGHFLTHLNFNCVKVTRWQLKQALIHTPNLQALSINLINSFRGIEATKLKNCDADKIIISPNLATLQIIEDCEIQLADWILRLCAHQLVNLSITTQNHQFLDYVFRRKFEKLKQLQIHFSHFCEIWHGVSHPELEYLSIDMLFYLCDDIHYKIYMDFIGQFSSTLVHLGLSWHAVSRGYFGYLKEKGILFPKIRSLTLRNHSYNVSWEGTQAKRDAEVLFPNVRDVKIVDVEYGYAPRNLI